MEDLKILNKNAGILYSEYKLNLMLTPQSMYIPEVCSNWSDGRLNLDNCYNAV